MSKKTSHPSFARFIVSSSLLTARLDALKGVVPSKPLLEIHACFLFEYADSVLSVTTSDATQWLSTLIPVDSTADKFFTCVPAKKLTDLLGKLPEQPLTLAFDTEGSELYVYSVSGLYKLPLIDAAGWPESTEASEPISFVINALALQHALNRTTFAAGTDDTKPEQTAVCITSDTDGLSFVATDGHRVCRVVRPDEGAPGFTALLPRRSAEQLTDLLKKFGEGEITLDITPTTILIDLGQYTLLTRQIEGKYPGIGTILAQKNPYTLEVDRKQVIAAITRLLLFAEKETATIKLVLRSGKHNAVFMTAHNAGQTMYAREDFILSSYDGDEMTIGFDGKLLRELLEHVDGPGLCMRFMAPMKHAIIEGSLETQDVKAISILIPHALLSSQSDEIVISKTMENLQKDFRRSMKHLKDEGVSVSVKRNDGDYVPIN